ncbi:MAG: hypothetical protein ACLFPA_00685 [Dichotomicrobium sp.]
MQMAKALSKLAFRGILVCLGVSALAISAPAQDANETKPPELSLELNTIESTQQGCRLTFVIRNQLAQPIEALGFEIALFGPDGAVTEVIALDAGSLPDGKTRVRQFRVPDVTCTEVSRVLLNDVTKCEGDGLSPAGCIGRLSLSSRVQSDFVL